MTGETCVSIRSLRAQRTPQHSAHCAKSRTPQYGPRPTQACSFVMLRGFKTKTRGLPPHGRAELKPSDGDKGRLLHAAHAEGLTVLPQGGQSPTSRAHATIGALPVQMFPRARSIPSPSPTEVPYITLFTGPAGTRLQDSSVLRGWAADLASYASW
jgi:hypothetical protein